MSDILNIYFNTRSFENEKYCQTCIALRNSMNYSWFAPERNLNTMLETSAEASRTPPSCKCVSSAVEREEINKLSDSVKKEHESVRKKKSKAIRNILNASQHSNLRGHRKSLHHERQRRETSLLHNVLSAVIDRVDYDALDHNVEKHFEKFGESSDIDVTCALSQVARRMSDLLGFDIFQFENQCTD